MNAPKVYKIKMMDKWWQLVCDRKKIIEGRINRDHHASVIAGDTFEIENIDTGFVVHGIVMRTVKYPSFRKMLTYEGIENVLPGIQDLDEGVNVYYSIDGYKEQESKHGVVAIELSPYNYCSF